MPTPALIKEPPFSQVAAGGTALLELPRGMAYSAFYLLYSETGGVANDATFASDIDEIRFIVDNRVKMRITGTELTQQLAYDGISHPDGIFPIFFADPTTRTAAEEDGFEYGTQDVSNLSIEVDINSGATAPALSLYTARTPNRFLGLHEVVDTKTYSFTGSGEKEINDIVLTGTASPFRAIKQFKLTGSTITEVELIRSDQVIFSATNLVMEGLVEAQGKTRQTNAFHMDFNYRGRFADYLVLTGLNERSGRFETVNNLRLRLQVSGTGNVTLVTRAIEEKPRLAA
jgi:hypothetical protein